MSLRVIRGLQFQPRASNPAVAVSKGAGRGHSYEKVRHPPAAHGVVRDDGELSKSSYGETVHIYYKE